jgi:D-sorbitol dehydrogenase (acceptor)
MVPLTNRRVLVTGAAKNIGLAIAHRCLEEGARVMLVDLRDDSLHEAVAALPADFASRTLTAALDVRDRAAVESAVAQMVRVWGGIDAVVNNAGIYPDRLLLDMSEDEWDQVMDINAKGTFLVAQAAARQMVQQGAGGHVINIASGSYRFGRVGSGHYCASKAAVVMLTQVMAMELAQHGIQVNSVAPGLISSDQMDPQYSEVFARSIPAGRVGRPDDVAAGVLMILQSGCTYLSGQTISVDGALSAGRFGLPLSHGSK